MRFNNPPTLASVVAALGYTPVNKAGDTGIGSLAVALGTITADAQMLSGTATWNNAAVTFTGLKFNVTSTASAAASLLADLQVAGVSQFKVDKSGNVTFLGTGTFGGSVLGPGADWAIRAAAGFSLQLEADGGGVAKRVNWSGTTLGMPAGSIISGVALTLTGALTVAGVAVAALTSTGTFTSGAGAQVGTLTNAPAAGNPTTWIKIVDNGVTRYIPAW